METLIVTTDTVANAKFLANFLKTVKPVKSVLIEKKEKYTEVSEPEEEYNWINPSRPATDEEFEQMCREMDDEEEAGLFFTPEEVKAKALNTLKKWKRQNQK